jgi:hypothetical protein
MSTYAAIPSYLINPAYLDENVSLGAGIDMRDPLTPKAAPGRPFVPPSDVEQRHDNPRFGLETSDAAIQDTFRFQTASTATEEEQIIAENFKASYGLNSVSQAGTFARQERSEYHTTYALLEHVGESRTLQHGTDRQWTAPPLEGEPLEGPEQVRERFFDVYGTHYVSQAKYGLRIAIQAKMRKSEKHSSQEMQATFKAAFGAAGASGGVTAQKKQALTEMGVEIMCEVSSGGVVGGGLPTLTDLDAIDEYLRELRSGEKAYSVGPISLSLKDYPPTLHPGWREYAALQESVPASPELEYGVPLGTVVPWYPPSTHVEGLRPAGPADAAPAELRVRPPLGWAICDGQAGTPDLRSRFVLGVGQEDWTGTPSLGGSRERVTLTTEGGPVGPSLRRGTGTAFHPSNYGHTHVIDLPEPQLPPFVGLVYIMRVA